MQGRDGDPGTPAVQRDRGRSHPCAGPRPRVESGAHAELIARPGVYRQLMAPQLGSAAAQPVETIEQVWPVAASVGPEVRPLSGRGDWLARNAAHSAALHSAVAREPRTDHPVRHRPGVGLHRRERARRPGDSSRRVGPAGARSAGGAAARGAGGSNAALAQILAGARHASACSPRYASHCSPNSTG
jgi:hypothetical protein